MPERLINENSDATIIASANQAIKTLENMQKYQRTTIPMSEFAKILIWEKEELQRRWETEMYINKKKGVTYENRKWCGIPYDEFKIPGLHIY